MAATAALDEFQVTEVVRFCVEPSEYVPVAVNCLDVPSAKLGLVGVTAIETSVAGVTVNVELPETLPDVAEIVVEPVDTEVANPFDPAALLIAATAVLDDFQVTPDVRFCVEPSE
jgi:predicted nucleic acid-binding protein